VSSVPRDHFYAEHAVVAVVVDDTVHADAIVTAAEVGNVKAVVAVANAAAVILVAASDVGNVKAVIAAELAL
jgi:hypothetical protein